ncbi:MAG TPA: glycosyltransferase family 39 protein [Stellaceae bacterium]|nr:glycosyltransferase family 39 protein [Stellaceae bacterium]
MRPAPFGSDSRTLLARPGFLGIDGSWDGLSRALFLVVTILVLITFTDYGITWDEDVHNYYGILVLNYYLSGFTDLRSTHWQDLFNYGGAFDMLAAALNTVSPFDTYETRHLLNGLVGILGLVGVWRLGRTLGGPRAGFLAALLLALTPNYYGQMFNNPKDVPFAAGMVWGVYYLVGLARELPRPRGSLLLKFGLAMGLALGIRVGGLLLLSYLGLLLGLSGVWRAFTERRAAILVSDGARSLFVVLLPIAAIAYAVMLVFWPFAQLDPIHNPLQALANFSHQVFPWKTLFAGEYVPATDLPWAYLPVHVALALPELVLILLASAPVFAVVAIRKSGVDRATVLGYAVVGFAVVFPIAYAIAIKAVLFDGMRHFIFVLPPIAALAAVMMDRALDWVQRLSFRRWAYAALGLYAAAHVGIMAMLHPDEYVYYNAFIGGVEGADGLFKTDYWANSYAEAVGGLEDYLHAEFGSDYMDHDFKVAVCGPPISAAFYFPPNFVFTKERSRADFFIAFTKDDCQKALPGREVYRVERMGVLLSIVLDHRSYLATASAQAPATVK